MLRRVINMHNTTQRSYSKRASIEDEINWYKALKKVSSYLESTVLEYYEAICRVVLGINYKLIKLRKDTVLLLKCLVCKCYILCRYYGLV